MANFQPVWVSTDEHLNNFYSIYKNTSLLEKLFGAYRFPPNFPYIHMFWGILLFNKVPVVLVASGIAEVDNASFSLKPKPFNTFGSITKNLLNLEFVISANEITRVSTAKAKSPILQYYNIPFIRVQTNRDGLLNNFLVCVGGSGPSMKKVNSQSAELLQVLEKLTVAK